MFKKILLSLFIMLVFTPGAFCQDAYIHKQLPSGQNVIIRKVSSNPIVTIDTWIKTGSIDEDEKTSGLAHFLEHLFFKGTQKYPSGTFDKILESKGAITNAATSKDFTHYYITIPSKDFDLALSMHSDMLLNPMIPRYELEKERLVVLEEISKNLDSPNSVMSTNLFKILYEDLNHPYFRPVIGSKNVIETISRDEVLDFYNKHYVLSNMTTVVVGDIEPEIAIKKIEELFIAKDIKKQPQATRPKVKAITRKLKFTDTKNVETAYITIAYRTSKFSDTKDLYALDVLGEILGGSKSSRLVQSLKEQKELVYSISAGAGALLDDGIFSVQATFDPKNSEKVEQQIYKEIDLIKHGDITDNEIEKAKNMIKTDKYYSNESISDIASEFGYLSIYFNDMKFYDNYIQNIERVKKSDVIRVAKKYLNNDKNAISVVLPENYKEKKVEVEISKNYSAKTLEKNDKTTKYQLENGAILLIRKNNANSIVAIDINAKGGKFLEKVPTSSILAANTAKDGTKSYTNKELSEFLDEKGIKLGLSSDNDVFSLVMQTTVNELDSALSILDEVVNFSTFSKSDIEKEKKMQLASIKSLRDNPISSGLDTFKAEAFKGSVYANNSVTIEKNINNVTKNDIEEYYKNILSSQNLVISISGDVDEQKIINAMSQIFKKTSPKTIEIKQIKMQTFKPKTNIKSVVKKADVQTAWIFIGFKTCSKYELKDIATLKVINAILGEGMSSRLFTNLRDNQGLAYAVGSTTLQNALDGVFVAYIGTNPKNIEIAEKGILNEFNTLKTEFVPKNELQEAKDKVLGNLLISIETNMDEASFMGYSAVLGRNINYLDEYKRAINDVTQSDILSVVNKYFDKPYIMTVVQP